MVAECELFPDSSYLWPYVTKIQRATEAASLAPNPSSLCFCGQRSWLQLCHCVWKVEMPCVQIPIKAQEGLEA